MKTTKEIWDAMQPVQTDFQLAKLMRLKAEKLEEVNAGLQEKIKLLEQQVYYV